MSFNLSGSVKAFFTDQLITAIAGTLEEPKERIEKAVDAAVPSVLAGVLNEAGSTEGALSILSLSKTVSHSTESLQLTDFLDEETKLTAERRGANLLLGIFSYRNLEVEGALAGYADIKDSSASVILKMAATAALNVIGNHAEYNSLSVGALMGELHRQKDDIIRKVPAELPLAKSLGLGHLSLISEKFSTSEESKAPAAFIPPKSIPQKKASEPFTTGWLWLLIVLALAVFIALLIMRGCSNKKEPVSVVTEKKEVAVQVDKFIHKRIGKLDTLTRNFIYEVGGLMKIKLPDGTELEVGENSTEAVLYHMITDKGFKVNETDKTQGWLPLDRVYFEKGSAKLTEDSKKQLTNIYAILKAFGNVQLKIGGYTDNSGVIEINQPLSDARAQAAMAYLVKEGIGEDRLKAEGYGEEHPVCPQNDSDECKAQNRRVDVRITKK